MSSSKHLQATFTNYDGQWLLAVGSGQGRSAREGDQVTVHTKAGELQQWTLTNLVTTKMIGRHGRRVEIWDARRGWVEADEESSIIEGTFTKYDGQWSVLMRVPDDRSIVRHELIRVRTKSGKVKRARAVEHVATQDDGAQIWSFTDGWAAINDRVAA